MDSVSSRRAQIAAKRERLARGRLEYQRTTGEMSVEYMVEILSRVASEAFRYSAGNDPSSACYAIARVHHVLEEWYKKHHVIVAYHKLVQELEKLEIEEMRDG